MLILIVSLWILTGMVTGVVASDKGHGFGSWVLAGLLLGPIGLIAAAGLSDQKLREYIRRTIEHESSWPIESNQTLFGQTQNSLDSMPKLLNESQINFDSQTEKYSKDKFIGDFLLNKNASEDQIWIKALEILQFAKPDLADLANRSQSYINESLTGGRLFTLCTADGEKLALAYSKMIPDNESLYWKIRIY